MTSLTDKRAEFEKHVWDHSADEFQAQFDERRDLNTAEIAFLGKVHRWVLQPDEQEALLRLQRALNAEPDLLAILLQLCGLTRNKILTDLRASAAARGTKIPSDFRRIPATSGWTLAGPYLLSRLRAVFGRIDPQAPSTEQLLQSVNQATWPGYIRQQRAKLSGHEAEYRLAVLFASLDISFVPTEKAENPLCRDAQIGGISFDLVAPDLKKPLLCVMSTVHTANIGQYGQSKTSGDTDKARHWIDSTFNKNQRPTLLAFADGVGFRSNRQGLDAVLTHADEFCQFSSIWKAVVIAAKRLNQPVQVALPKETLNEFHPFISRWRAEDILVELETLTSTNNWLEAGEGFVTRIE